MIVGHPRQQELPFATVSVMYHLVEQGKDVTTVEVFDTMTTAIAAMRYRNNMQRLRGKAPRYYLRKHLLFG